MREMLQDDTGSLTHIRARRDKKFAACVNANPYLVEVITGKSDEHLELETACRSNNIFNVTEQMKFVNSVLTFANLCLFTRNRNVSHTSGNSN